MDRPVKGFMGALSTLSVVPLWTDSIDGRATMPWFPVVGLVLGVVVWAVGYGVDHVAGKEGQWITALSVVLAGVVLTGGLHMDGLSDTFDGLFGGNTKERRLSIMKDPHAGTFGIVAIVMLLATKLVGAAYLAKAGGLWWVVPSYITSRVSMVLLASTLRYARTEGGTGRAFVDGVTIRCGALALGLGVVLLYLVGAMGAMVLLLAGIVVTACVGMVAHRRIGGVTGDVLGATSEMVEATTMVVAAILISQSGLTGAVPL